uniref:Uncharacterized protein LOC108044719 isoform X2 n=1 Tax=Drosophila rhopaloa TaxID=1041015 RepID=A0A6P4EM72_DRORH
MHSNGMIVETIENPSTLKLHSFDQHLDNAENILHRIETYRLKLNDHIYGMKKLVATNRSLIARLQDNELKMKALLEDKAQDKQMGLILFQVKKIALVEGGVIYVGPAR